MIAELFAKVLQQPFRSGLNIFVSDSIRDNVLGFFQRALVDTAQPSCAGFRSAKLCEGRARYGFFCLILDFYYDVDS